MSSCLTDEITIPADPEVPEVSDGICTYVEPDGSERMVSNPTTPTSGSSPYGPRADRSDHHESAATGE